MSQTWEPETGDRVLPLLPLRDILIFPSNTVPLFVGREKSIRALQAAMNGSKQILLAGQKDGQQQDPGPEDIESVGTVATILQLLRLPDGTVKVLVEGLVRAQIRYFVDGEDFFAVACDSVRSHGESGVEVTALVRTLKGAFENYVRLNKRMPPEMLLQLTQIEDPARLSDALVAHIGSLKVSERQALLAEANVAKRLEMLFGHLQAEVEIIRVEKKIRSRVKRQMEKTQKEYYLNEQMAAIQKELGDRDDGQSEIAEMEEQISNRPLPADVREKLRKELRKLRSMSSLSAEATVVRNYLDTVLSLPWGEYTVDLRDLEFAEQILNRDHFGLEKAKERVLEYLAVQNLVDVPRGPILCFVGPPGVGKTSLVRSVAEALGRKFVRISLGGVHDQSEIRGHRKTYIGSMPGKIIMALKKAASSNPVVLLDEIDKMSRDYRGDPAAALLEVLDPEQNSTFSDHYLDLDYDLSKVLFVATANSLETMPAPLLDRMEVIRIAGYTEEEKIEIARRYLIEKQKERNGLAGHEVMLTTGALVEMIHHYTKEAGVRNLEREISQVLRKFARKNLAKLKGNSKNTCLSEKISSRALEKFLGPRRFRGRVAGDRNEIGICTGLAWTSTGGEILTIEVVLLRGNGKLTITGKLGDVMQESARAAVSYVRSRAEFLGIDESFYQNRDIHIHVPEGAIPKDGPSAGLTMATALTSALTGRPVRRDLAMTGEITLRGKALPIGGLKEKALAAKRAGIQCVLFPEDNRHDLEELPRQLTRGLDLIPVHHMDEVLLHALVWSEEERGEQGDPVLLAKLKQGIDGERAQRVAESQAWGA